MGCEAEEEDGRGGATAGWWTGAVKTRRGAMKDAPRVREESIVHSVQVVNHDRVG